MGGPHYDRALLLHGPKRNDILTLADIQQYGIDSFANADYLRLYDMSPAEGFAHGIRLLGRTAVECTRDELADPIGRDIAHLAAAMRSGTHFTVIDPFAGSCNTLYWILRHLPGSTGVAVELDRQVYALSRRNIAGLDQKIELLAGDYKVLLRGRRVPPDHAIIVFVAPPWGTALDEVIGLDLRRTTPPIADVVDEIGRQYPNHRIVYAIQVYHKLNPESRTELRSMLDWSQLRIYHLAGAGGDHGLLLGTKGWRPVHG